jgi:drug/metabolite transporter (DMT)-like permease
MSRLQADLLLLLAAAIWGFAFVFQKTAMEDVGPFTFIAARSVVAALALAPLAWLEARRAAVRAHAISRPPFAPAPAAPGPALGPIALAGGVAFFFGAALQQWGLVTATVTNASFLTALYVVVVPFLGWAAWRTQPGARVWFGAGMCFVGVWLLGGGSIAAFGAGDGLVALSAVFWAVHLLVTARAAAVGLPIAFTCLQFVVVALCAAVAAAATEATAFSTLQGGLLSAWKEIAYVGLLSSALTFTLLTVALRHAPPAEAAILVSTENLFAALAGAWLLGERLPPIGWVGAAVIMAAILLVQRAEAGERDRPGAA